MSLTNTALMTPSPSHRQWIANLTLDFAHSIFGTQLVKTTRQGPLSVQKAFYPEGPHCAHIYLLHPPAGIVSGDDLTININIDVDAQVLFTTPGGNRFYRAREDSSIGVSTQKQTTAFHLGVNAVCENFPQETIVYEQCDAYNTVDIHMDKTSVYLGWDITCLGLPSSQQPFSQGNYTQLNRLYCDNALVFHDRIALTPENQLLHHVAGLASHSVFGTFLAYSPNLTSSKISKHVAEQLTHIITTHDAQDKISITEIDGLLVIRYLGSQAYECKTLFVCLWQVLRPIFHGKEAIIPRIWHT